MSKVERSLEERLEGCAQAMRAAHLLSCEATCREAITALRQSEQAEERGRGYPGGIDILKARISSLEQVAGEAISEWEGWNHSGTSKETKQRQAALRAKVKG